MGGSGGVLRGGAGVGGGRCKVEVVARPSGEVVEGAASSRGRRWGTHPRRNLPPCDQFTVGSASTVQESLRLPIDGWARGWSGADAQVIEVSLLGPPRVERDGVLMGFDTRKALALLAVLVAEERPRTRDALAEMLWPDHDPEHARGALRRTLSTVRTAVGAELVEATHDHVRLVKGPGISVDVDRFRDLCRGGELRAAVDLFRGDFLEGLVVRDAPDFEEWVRLEGDVLRRELTRSLAALTAAQEAAGDLAGALATARRWLAVDALHEPAHQALIRLYAATGDRAAALVQYRECARILSHELGVQPLAGTTELYDAVNRGTYVPSKRAPDVDSPGIAAKSPQVRQAVVPMVGREEELRRALAVYDAVGPDGGVLLVEGEAGIGKTRFAEELLGPMRRRGVRVLEGRAFEDEFGLAYAPVLEALTGRLREDDDWVARVNAHALREASRLVPALARGRPNETAASVDDPGAEVRFLSAVWDVLTEGASGGSPGALFFDDLQWADDATLALIGYGLRRLAGRPLLLVLAWRTPHDHALRRAVEAASGTSHGAVLRLGRLDTDEIAALVSAARPGDQPSIVEELARRTEGVPLLVVEYLRVPDLDEHGPQPSGVSNLFRSRLAPVTETGQQVLAAAAVLGRSFDVDAVRTVSGRTDEETVAALEELVRRGLIAETAVDYTFSHDLLRGLVYDETSLARRRLLHLRAARIPGAPPASVARHLRLAGRTTEAAEAFRLAGEQARGLFANAEALELLRTALELGHPDRTGLQAAVGELLILAGDYNGALQSLEAAAQECRADERAAVEHLLGRLQQRRGEYASAEAHLQAALSAAPAADGSLRSAITADLSMVAESLGDAQRAQGLAERARVLADGAGDERALCRAYNLLGMLSSERGHVDSALQNLERSRRLAERIGEVGLRVAALNNLALVHASRRELEEAIEMTSEALALCTAMGDRHHEAALHNNLADFHHAAGRAEQSMTHLKKAVEIFAEIGAEGEPRPAIWQLARW